MAKQSDSCRDPATGAWLWEYENRREATRSRQPASLVVREMEAYECGKCGLWHRRPIRDGAIPTDVLCMHCVGRDGMPKQSYATADDAMLAADFLSSVGPDLSIYVCPHGRGWHLTKG